VTVKVSRSVGDRDKVSAPKGDGRVRRALIADAPRLLGASWTSLWCETLRREGRKVDGGWPGTRSESRVRVRRHLDGELSKRGLPPLDEVELEEAAAAMYRRAKCDWLALVNSHAVLLRLAEAEDIHET
jgi:hypothetical protein